MPFCSMCLEPFDEEDSVGGRDEVCPACYEQQMRESEDAAILAELEDELEAMKRHDLVSDEW